MDVRLRLNNGWLRVPAKTTNSKNKKAMTIVIVIIVCIKNVLSELGTFRILNTVSLVSCTLLVFSIGLRLIKACP